MKRIVMILGALILVLGGAAAWMNWQQQKENARAQAAEIKRLADEAEAKAQAEARAAAEAAEQKAADTEESSRRTQEAPVDEPEGAHFRFVHYAGERVGYDYGSQEKRPPLYSQLLCNDGVIQPMTFDYGWIQSGSSSYDFYKVPGANKGNDEICLSLRKEDVTSFKPLFTSTKAGCDPNAAGSSCATSLTTRSCNPADQSAIRFRGGKEKDVIRWCEVTDVSERFGFLQAVTQRDQSCEIKSWVKDGDKLLPLGITYKGEFKVEEGSKGPASCVFPLADGDIPERDMTDRGGPMSPMLIFELGQKTYIVYENSGSEGFTSTLYRVNADSVEEVVDYYNYVIDYNFWRATGEADLQTETEVP
jgi:hypothetical protein